MALNQNNFNVGSPPQGPNPAPFTAPEFSSTPTGATGLSFNPATAASSQQGAMVAANPGSTTGGSATQSALNGVAGVFQGLGGALQNPSGFAQQVNPMGGVATGTNLTPSTGAVKGAGDIASLDPRTWYPGVMTLWHSTRTPGGATSQ